MILASLALLVGGKAAALEPLAVLTVSFLASQSVIGHVFRGKVDDTLVRAGIKQRGCLFCLVHGKTVESIF